MSNIRTSSDSRVRFSDLLKIDGITFWDIVEMPEYRSRGDEFYHQTLSGDRIDLLSQRYYGVPSKWWVIAWANNFESIPVDLKEGDTIIIPSPSYVESILQG